MQNKVNLGQIKSWDFKSKSRIIILIVGVLFSVFSIMSSGFIKSTHGDGFVVVKGLILTADNSRLEEDPYLEGIFLGVQTIEIEILEGEFAGQRFRINNTLSRLFNNYAKPDMKMLFVVMSENGELTNVDMYGYNRDTFIYVLVALFILVLIVVGRKQGVYSAIALAFTLITVIFFMIPLIINGFSPVLAAIITALITTLFTIFLVADFSKKSIAAIGGITIGVIIAGIVAIVASNLGHVSGLYTENAEEVLYVTRELPMKMSELLFAGIIIAALGGINDVGMSISSAIFEVQKANPSLKFKDLYNAGMNIGRDVIGTMSNTLILAFVGSSLNLIIIIAMYDLSYIRFINLNILAVEVVQGISASIGLILTVPVTALIAATLAKENKSLSEKSGKKKVF